MATIIIFVVVVDESLAFPASSAKDPAGNGEGGGREGRGGAHLVEAVLQVVASVLQTRDVGAEAGIWLGKKELKGERTERVKVGRTNVIDESSRRNVTCNKIMAGGVSGVMCLTT